MADRPILLDYTPEQLRTFLTGLGQPGFRAAQIFRWLHQGVIFADMSNLPKAFREALSGQAVDMPLRLQASYPSKKDQTVKFLNACVDGNVVESVLMVALRNTNHWMRAATYGYQACEVGMAAICFTNTIPNMPAWGALDARLGNNPLVLAIPSPSGDVVLDMAASQFSYGALEKARMEGRQMSVDAGYDANGDLTRDPDAVLQTQRILPMGYWKGAGLSILLDLFAGCFSLGNTTLGISRLSGEEHAVFGGLFPFHSG